MKARLQLSILPQPDDLTCGPTCLQSVYSYFDDDLPLQQVISETPRLKEGGTLAVFLAAHALRRGYKATIYTYNLQVFDPTWFRTPGVDMVAKLKQQWDARGHDDKLRLATRGYIDFLELGGRVRQEDLSPALLRRFLNRHVPILTGLSSTYLYQAMREMGTEDDDIRGEPQGHFVVLSGYDRETKEVSIADPWFPNPTMAGHYYSVQMERVINAILLGIVTYDANLLIIEPLLERAQENYEKPAGRQ